MTIEQLIEVLVDIPHDVWLGAFAGAISYLFDMQRARKEALEFKFRFSSLLVNSSIGAFVAYLLGTVLAENVAGRDALIGVSGLTAYNIVLLLQSQGAAVIVDKFLGGTKK